MEKGSSNSCRILTFIAGGFLLMVLTAVITGLITKSLWGGCDNKLTLSKKPEWDLVTRFDVPERGLTVSRLVSQNRCYIMPSGVSDTPGQGRPMVISEDKLGFDVIEHIAGPNAASFCQGYDTYMVREFKPDELEDPRIKRDNYPSGGAALAAGGAAPAAGGAAPAAGGAAPAAGGAAPAAGGAAPAAGSAAELAAKVPTLTGTQVTGDGKFGGAVPPSGIAANIPIEQRQPRCDFILLDCVTMVGQVQSCWTWQNGRIWMDRKCESPTKFVMRMTKPPGRILKVAQQETVLCLSRHKDNKEC